MIRIYSEKTKKINEERCKVYKNIDEHLELNKYRNKGSWTEYRN